MNNVTVESIPVLLKVLETMTFMCGVIRDTEDLPTEIPGALKAKLEFSGPVSGKVDLWSDVELLETIASILGDEECSPSDTLGEILNVLTGQILTTLGDDCIAFDLGIPSVEAATQGSWLECQGDQSEVGFIEVEDMPILVRVSLES